jgi:hypothetical protein
MELNIVSLALLGWIPACAALFLFFRPVRALTLAYLVGWLLLPVDALEIKGFWDVDKILATNFGVILGTVLFCPWRFRLFRFNVPEAILLIYASGTILTSLTNGLGIYDGVSSFTYRVFYTAVPFCFGRAFVRSREDLMEIARIIVAGASVCALLAIWEWRMSPHIHKTLYGYFQHSFHQHMRWGFFRPIICFKHALGLGTFFAWTSLLAIAMYRAGELRLRTAFRLPPSAATLYVILPVIGLLTGMSLGPWGLFVIGIGIFVYRTQGRWRRLVWGPIVLAIGWMGGRYSGVLDGAWADAAVRSISEKRADSLQTRVNSETLTIQHASQRPLFGWGGFGRSRARDHRGNEVVTDGMWIILVGMYGVVGLVSFYAWWIWPIVMSRRAPDALAEDPVVFPILIAIGMQAVNLLFNGFLSPILTLIAGGVVTAVYASRRMPAALRAATPAPIAPNPQPQPGITA